jgi:hypothetical protein
MKGGLGSQGVGKVNNNILLFIEKPLSHFILSPLFHTLSFITLRRVSK